MSAARMERTIKRERAARELERNAEAERERARERERAEEKVRYDRLGEMRKRTVLAASTAFGVLAELETDPKLKRLMIKLASELEREGLLGDNPNFPFDRKALA